MKLLIPVPQMVRRKPCHAGAEKDGEQFKYRAIGTTGSFKKILWGEEKNYSVDQVMERMEQYIRINGDEKENQARVWYPGKRQNAEHLIVEDF